MPAKKPIAKPPSKKASKGKPTPTKQTAAKVPKVGLPTQLAAIQDRYRHAMMDICDRPGHEQASLISAAIATMIGEKAALGVKDGEESTVTAMEPAQDEPPPKRTRRKTAAADRAN